MANEEKLRQYLFRVTSELHRYRQAADRATADPVVITGMSCRFPGQVATPAELWRLVEAGGDAITGFPGDRGWDTENGLGPQRQRAGGFLDGAGQFDAAFFDLGPQEADALDPQQRLLLETAWEVLEASGIDASRLRAHRVGVYVGMTSPDYGSDADVRGERADYLTTGAASSAASGRIAYTLGLDGPAMTIDTACSSSLVALDLACRALRTGEVEMALVGGVTVMATSRLFAHYARRQELAADGRCKPFSAAADGMGLAEGAGMLLLERLSGARREGHPVLAVVRGSAVGQGGTASGLTAPSGPAQERVIGLALADAQLTPDQVDAVEAHGTGSMLGDQIEAQALVSAYGRARQAPLWLGSVKSNIGHTQAASGVAAVIKAVLALGHERLPATLHVTEPVPEVDWDSGQIRLLTESVSWPRGQAPRRIGVSAFGFTGTNAHAILEEPPATEPAEGLGSAGAPVSGESVESAKDGGTGTGAGAGVGVGAGVDSGGAGEALRRPGVVPWPVSAAGPGALRAQAVRLGELSEADPADVGLSLARGRAPMRHRAVIVGESPADFRTQLDRLAQEERVAAPPRRGELVFLLPDRPVAGGAELAAAFPVFAAALAGLRGDCDSNSSGDSDSGGNSDGGALPPAAAGMALYRLLESFGVTPGYVAGRDAERFCAGLAGPGGQPEPVPELAELAAIGTTFQLGLGPQSALDIPADACLFGDAGPHSAPGAHGDRGTRDDPGAHGDRGTRDDPGAHGDACPPGVAGPPGGGQGEPAAFLTALARVWEHGHDVDWRAAFDGTAARMVPLPTYPFDRRRHWLEVAHPVLHPLLGASADLAAESRRRWSHRLDPWYGDGHRLFGVPVLPAGAAIEWAVAARSMVTGLPVALENLRLHRLPPLPADVQTVAGEDGLQGFARSQPEQAQPEQAQVEQAQPGQAQAEQERAGNALAEQSWTEVVSAGAGVPAVPSHPAPAAPQLGEQDVEAVYAQLSRAGLDYGQDTRALSRLWRRDGEVLALVRATADSSSRYVLDPVALDAALRAAALLRGDGLWVVSSAERLTVLGRLAGGDFWCRARRCGSEQCDNEQCGGERLDLELWSLTGELLVLVTGLQLEPADPQTLSGTSWLRVQELSALLVSDPGAARDSLLTAVLGRLESLGLTGATAGAPLSGTGLGSLQAVRLRDALARDYAADVPLSVLLGGSTPAGVAELICDQLAVRDLLATTDTGADADAEVLTI